MEFNIEHLRDNVEDGGADHISPMLNSQKDRNLKLWTFQKIQLMIKDDTYHALLNQVIQL